MNDIRMRLRLVHRFYGPILLLEALGQVRGDRQKAEMISDEPGLHDTKLRRHFCNALAYVCAFDTGSDSVTAVALDAQPSSTNVLIAANKGVSSEVIDFLQKILSILHRIAQGSNDTDIALAQEEIIYEVVKCGQPRVRRYHEEAVEMYKSCFQIMESAHSRYAERPSDQLERVMSFLNQYFKSDTSLETVHECLDLVKQCHGLRSTGMIDSLNAFAAHGQHCQSKFVRLQELLKKFGKHVTCSRRLVNAATQLSDEFAFGFNVEPIGPSTPVRITFPLKKATVESIIGRMVTGTAEQDKIKEQLKQRRPHGLEDISQHIKSRREVVHTQTHAELLVLNHIEQHGCSFPEPNDRYIGCSKPACYLCHLYIRHHPGNYSLPDTSNKLYVKWRMPDITSSDENTRIRLNREAEEILDKMVQEIITDFRNDVTRPKRKMHADSSADMTSTVAGPGGSAGAAGAGPESTPLGIVESFESLSLNGPAHAQESPTAAIHYNNHNPPLHLQQPSLPLPLYPQFQFPPSYPYTYQALYPHLPISLPSTIPEINSTSAAYSFIPVPLPFHSIGNSNSGTAIMQQYNNNVTSFNNHQDQPVPNSQRARRPGWRGPPNRRWASHIIE